MQKKNACGAVLLLACLTAASATSALASNGQGVTQINLNGSLSTPLLQDSFFSSDLNSQKTSFGGDSLYVGLSGVNGVTFDLSGLTQKADSYKITMFTTETLSGHGTLSVGDYVSNDGSPSPAWHENTSYTGLVTGAHYNTIGDLRFDAIPVSGGSQIVLTDLTGSSTLVAYANLNAGKSLDLFFNSMSDLASLSSAGFFTINSQEDGMGAIGEASFTAVPEPSTWFGGAFCVGSAGLAFVRRFKRL